MNSYQTENTQINLLAGVTDGASALDRYRIVISLAAVVPYIASHAANAEIISTLWCQLLNIFAVRSVFLPPLCGATLKQGSDCLAVI